MKTKIILAAVVASLIVLPWMAFTGDIQTGNAFPAPPTQAEIDQMIAERESQKQNPWLCMQIGWGC